MEKFFYFAYGSNLFSHRLRGRTPSAQLISSARLDDYRLTFHKISQDGSGKCHIEYTAKQIDSVYGVIFEINSSEKKALDKAEALGFGYDEKLMNVVTPDGRLVEVILYFGTSLNKNLKPYCWYKSFVVEGAKEHNFPLEYIKKLEAIEFIEDLNIKRKLLEQKILTRK